MQQGFYKRPWLPSIVVLLALVGAGIFVQTAARAQEQRGFVDRVFTDQDGQHKYVVFVPSGYTPSKKWPVLLYLHGAGERGTDGRLPLEVGPGPYIRAHADTFPFIVVFPQCEDRKGRILTAWSASSPDGRRAREILKEVEKNYSIDADKRVLTGWSMGGYGAWSFAAAYPVDFSAVVPIAGGGDAATAGTLKNVPVWAFHGALDRVVLPEESRKMVEAVSAAGGTARYTEITGADHDSWKYVYSSDELYQWMLDPQGFDPSRVALRVRPGARPAAEADEKQPFVPALEIPDAVYLRMGNDMLDALAVSIPSRVPVDLLQGRINDIQEYTSAEGYGFSVRLSQISYQGALEQSIVRAYAPDRLNIQLGVRNVALTIGSTYMVGDGRSAVAGPMQVVIGHRRPAWLSIALEPYVQDRRLRLRYIAARFDIADDNWYVTGPAGVSVSGLGMTRDRVANGLVSGLYGKKGRIQNEVVAVVPRMLERLEENLELKDVGEVVSSFWPLPVYRPRLRLWPRAVSTDAEGVSVAFGMTAAAVDPKSAPARPRIVESVGPPPAELLRGSGMRIGVAPNVLEPLTSLLIDADVARIHVLDIPEKTFAPLGDRSMLAEAIPELNRFPSTAEVWSELILAAPLSVTDASERQATAAAATAFANDVSGSDDGSQPVEAPQPPFERMRFQTSRAIISLAVRPDAGSTEWTPFAEFEIAVGQDAFAQVLKPNFVQRVLEINWSGAPDIAVTGRFAPGYQPQDPRIDTLSVRALFTQAWRAWTHSGPVAQTAVEDVDFGMSRLRLADAAWTRPHLLVDFAFPGLKITNHASESAVYQVKGPTTGWGGPYTLAAGGSHVFPVPYAMIYRQGEGAAATMFTLPAGEEFVYRKTSDGRHGLFHVPVPKAADSGATVPKSRPDAAAGPTAGK